MTVKVITDSTSDIGPELAEALNITVVPIYVRFGDQVYWDGIDITSDEFYERLTVSPVHPATSLPTPGDFAGVYSEYVNRSDGIVSIHISSKLSGTCGSALLAKKMVGGACPIEVVDSKFNSVGTGLVVIAAARLAQSGESLSEVVAEAYKAIEQVHMFGMFETMKYLARSGRVDKTIAAAAGILKVMPLLTFKNGEIVRAGLVRTIAKGMDRIYDFVKNRVPVRELSIVHSAIPDQANQLRKRLGVLFPEDNIPIVKLGAGLGVHGGPGVLVLALRRLATD